MLRTPVNEVMAGQSARLIGSGPGGTKGPGQVTQLPAACAKREDDVSGTLLNQFIKMNYLIIQSKTPCSLSLLHLAITNYSLASPPVFDKENNRIPNY